MKKLSIILLASFAALTIQAQSIDEVLKTIEENNPDIKAAKALYDARSAESRMDNSLGNTSVNYEKMFGTKASDEETGKLTVTQEFDFPTLYITRSKLNREKYESYRTEYVETRQNVMLQAKLLCMDLIMLNRQRELINERLANINKLKDIYDRRMNSRDVTLLELNKIKMQQMDEEAALTMNTNERNSVIRQLCALNGGENIATEISYDKEIQPLPDYRTFADEATDADATLLKTRQAMSVANRELSMAKNKWLPTLGLSYIREFHAFDATNGIEIGVSLPLLSNNRNVKKAKAYKSYAMWQLEKADSDVRNNIQRDYDEAKNLWETLGNYDIKIVYENIELLNKALDAKQISMIEYFTELNSLYSIIESYNTLQNSYNKALARMYKYKL